MKKIPIEGDECTFGNPVCGKNNLFIVKEKNDKQEIISMELDKVYNSDQIYCKTVTVGRQNI